MPLERAFACRQMRGSTAQTWTARKVSCARERVVSATSLVEVVRRATWAGLDDRRGQQRGSHVIGTTVRRHPCPLHRILSLPPQQIHLTGQSLASLSPRTLSQRLHRPRSGKKNMPERARRMWGIRSRCPTCGRGRARGVDMCAAGGWVCGAVGGTSLWGQQAQQRRTGERARWAHGLVCQMRPGWTGDRRGTGR